MSLPNPTQGSWAVVTGASQGIGRALALDLARRGYPIILIARRAEVLEDIATTIRDRYKVEVEVMPSDLADPELRKDTVAKLRQRNVSILCNNAGTATFGPFINLDPEGETKQVQLNSLAVHDLVLAVLPGMVDRHAGAILNVGSAAGNMAIPHNATYTASKAFVNTFSESLRGELKGSGINVTLLAPGPIRPDAKPAEEMSIIDRLVPSFLWTSTEEAARQTLDALAKNKRRVVPGFFSKIMSVAGTYIPRDITAPIAGWFYKKLGENS